MYMPHQTHIYTHTYTSYTLYIYMYVYMLCVHIYVMLCYVIHTHDVLYIYTQYLCSYSVAGDGGVPARSHCGLWWCRLPLGGQAGLLQLEPGRARRLYGVPCQVWRTLTHPWRRWVLKHANSNNNNSDDNVNNDNYHNNNIVLVTVVLIVVMMIIRIKSESFQAASYMLCILRLSGAILMASLVTSCSSWGAVGSQPKDEGTSHVAMPPAPSPPPAFQCGCPFGTTNNIIVKHNLLEPAGRLLATAAR